MGVIVRAWTPDKATLLGTLPDFASLSVQQEFGGEGSLTMAYTRSGIGASALSADDALLTVVEDGVERTDWYVLEDDGDDPAAEEGSARTIDVGCRGTLALLTRARVYPATHTPGGSVTGLAPQFKFTAATPGAMVKELIDRAHARGTIPQVTYDFTAANSSSGAAWTQAYDVTFDTGVDLMKVVQAMADNGWCDFRMDGLTLRLFLPDTMGTDRPTTILHLGQAVTSGPRKRSRRDVASVMLGLGDNDTLVEVTNTTALSRFGRREGYESQGGIGDAGTLTAVTTARLFLASDVAEGQTVGVAPDAGGPQPNVDYFVGDKVRYDQNRIDSTNLEPMRVRSIADSWDNQGGHTVSVEFNDVFMETSLRLARRLDGILNGSTSGGTIPTPGGPDGTIPNVPSITSITSLAETDGNGASTAWVVVSWTSVTTNTDGSAITDLAGYEMQWKRSADATWISGGTTGSTSGSVHGVPIATSIDVRVRAFDTGGNFGDFSGVVSHVTTSDAAAPPQPAQPTVTVRLGVATVYWNGLGSANETMPGDFWRVEVHMSLTNNFTPTTATIQGYLFAAGNYVIADLPYNSVRYVKLVAVDRAGNKSIPSVQRSFTVTPLVDTDLIGQLVHSANIFGGAVDTAALASGAVDATKLLTGAVTFGKIAANAVAANELAANSVVAGKIAANAVTAGTVAALAISAGNIQANAITADKIAAGQITAEKLAVGAIDANSISVGMFGVNKVPNGAFEDLNAGGTYAARWAYVVFSGSAVSTVSTAAPNSGSRSLVLTANTGGSSVRAYSDAFPVSPGQEMVLTGWVRSSSFVPNGVYLRMGFGTTPAQSQLDPAPAYGDTYAGGPANTSYVKVGGRLIVPAGYRWASIHLYYFNAPVATNVYFDDIVAQDATSGVHIVDGSITATKISADAIDGKTITSVTINASTINASTINSTTILASGIYTTFMQSNDLYSNTVRSSTLHTNTIHSSTIYANTIQSAPSYNAQPRVQIDASNYSVVQLWTDQSPVPGDIRAGEPAATGFVQIWSPSWGASRSHISVGGQTPWYWDEIDLVTGSGGGQSIYMQSPVIRLRGTVILDAAIQLNDGDGNRYGDIYPFNPGYRSVVFASGGGGAVRADGDGWTRIVNANNIGIYAPIAASGFSNQSSAADKRLVGNGDLGHSAIGIVTRAPAKKWRYKSGPDDHAPVVGPMAEDLPDEFVTHDADDMAGTGKLVNLMTMIGILWKAVEETDHRLTALEDQT